MERYILIKEYAKGNYKLFRGGAKRLIKDIVYLMINENKEYSYDLNCW